MTAYRPAAVLHLQGADGKVPRWDGSEPLGLEHRFRVELASLEEPFVVLVYDEPDESAVVLAHGVVNGLVDGARIFDGPASGAELRVYGFDAVPSAPEEAWRGREPVIVIELR